jgi:hypothetical protein
VKKNWSNYPAVPIFFFLEITIYDKIPLVKMFTASATAQAALAKTKNSTDWYNSASNF